MDVLATDFGKSSHLPSSGTITRRTCPNTPVLVSDNSGFRTADVQVLPSLGGFMRARSFPPLDGSPSLFCLSITGSAGCLPAFLLQQGQGGLLDCGGERRSAGGCPTVSCDGQRPADPEPCHWRRRYFTSTQKAGNGGIGEDGPASAEPDEVHRGRRILYFRPDLGSQSPLQQRAVRDRADTVRSRDENQWLRGKIL